MISCNELSIYSIWSHAVTDPLGDNRRNPVKKQVKLHDQNIIIIKMMLVFYNRWKKYNTI